MSSVSSVRIPGLATGLDTDQMIKDMLTGEQSKIDKVGQKNQISKWQQESYRDIIKNVKGLYDKYFSATSPNFILSSKVFSTTTIKSSDSDIVSATAGAGANNINYKFKVDQMAKPPRLESQKLDKNQSLGEQNLIIGDSSKLKINGKEIELKATDKISDVIKKINDKFPNGEVKALYSEMTGKLTIEGSKTGSSSKLSFEGEFFKNTQMSSSNGNNVTSTIIDKTKTLKEQGIEGEININGQKIIIGESDTIENLVIELNKVLDINATYDEVTKQINIQSNGSLQLSGSAFEKMGIDTKLSKAESKMELNEDDKLLDKGIVEGKVKVNGIDIEITKDDTVKTLVDKINNSNSGVKAIYDETTKKLKLESKENLDLIGLESIVDSTTISREVITGKTINGSDNNITVYASDGKTVLRTINEQNNTFTIDNIIYNVNGETTGDKLVSMTSTKDNKQTVDKIQEFITEYNKMIDGIYTSVTQKKNRDYEPLTEAQKEDMSEEEIEKWEKKAKEGILKNDNELRSFMDDMKSAIFSPIGKLGVSLSDIGIKSDDDYNKAGQLYLDVDKFTKALEENGDLVYKATTGAFDKIKNVTYKYAGSSAGVFIKKAGMSKTSTEINNLFSEQIKKQEEQIKKLTTKMEEKESQLYKKFAALESNMNKLNSQMSYLTSTMGQ